MNRRSFIKNSFFSFTGIGLITALYSWQIEPFWLELVRIKMPLKNLPDNLIGKSIMQISDLHIGKRFDYQYIINSFNEVRDLNPDIVVYTGDYISLYENKVLYDELEEVLKFAVKGNMGTFAILGNHDYGINWSENAVADRISKHLESNNIKVLRNEFVEIDGLRMVGLDDFWGLNFNPKPILNMVDNKKANIILCHNPDVCDLDIWGNIEAWILSGHTHGGQVKAPFLTPPMLPVKNKKYDAGKIELNNERTLYVNRALGHLWQVRFNVRPEITLFELCKA